jgi:hypothetical protein
MPDLFAFEDTTPTDELKPDRLRWMLSKYLREGRFPEPIWGEIKGMLAQLKRGTIKPERLAKVRRYVFECRYDDGTEPFEVIDEDDRPEVIAAEAERERDYAEF